MDGKFDSSGHHSQNGPRRVFPLRNAIRIKNYHISTAEFQLESRLLRHVDVLPSNNPSAGESP